MLENIIEILSTNSLNRNTQEKHTLYSYFQTFEFFIALNSHDESGATLKSCVNSLQLEKYSENTSLPSGVYILLRGSAKYFNPKPEKVPKFLKSHSQQLKSGQSTKEYTFEPGCIFGQFNKTEKYSLEITKTCTFAVLSSEKYNEIIKTQEDLQIEKIEFLKTLELFKSWGRKAVKKAAKAFEKIEFRKGGIVYKESDIPEYIYLVKEGEFKLTQNYSIDLENNEKQHEFGTSSKLKYQKIKSFRRRMNLQVVLKQRGEIFGHNEFINKSPNREFTATCQTNYGIVFVISEKEFFKKFSHPETLRMLEEQNNVFSAWKSDRLLNLKSIETFKISVSHTPASQLKVTRRGETPTPYIRKREVEGRKDGKLPKIIARIINQGSGREYKNINVFKTELSVDLMKRKKYYY
jgi:CRP-like cAMP-binding protein